MHILSAVAAAGIVAIPGPPALEIVGDWQVRVPAGAAAVDGKTVLIPESPALDVDPPDVMRTRDERYDTLPVFNPDGPSWAKGTPLRGVKTEETTATDLLDPASLKVKRGPGSAAVFKRGVDYELDDFWGTFGRMGNGAIGEATPVWADYDHTQNRIDSIVISQNRLVLRKGEPHNALPLQPRVRAGEVRIANIWVPGNTKRLTEDNLFPVIEVDYKPVAGADAPAAPKLLPKTWKKLSRGGSLKVLAWGDSVTVGGSFLRKEDRYQGQFARMLSERFPDAGIEMLTAAWGGRTSADFLREPPGSPYNFEEAVLGPRPDLIVMEFVNDAYMSPEQVEESYSSLLERFKEIGAEWVILTPHFVRPDWMQAATVKIEQDPRPYVKGLRAFAAKHDVALADASLRWGHLAKEGIPYVTLLGNSINHPDARGHRLFALALMDLFGHGQDEESQREK